MNKEELVATLCSHGLVVNPKWTVPELRQTLIEYREAHKGEEVAALKGISKKNLAELREMATKEGIQVPEKATRGWLIRTLRDSTMQEANQVVTFGRYRGWLFCEVPKSYLDWAIAETGANPNALEDLKRLAKWAKDHRDKDRATLVEMKSPAYLDDPEATAVVKPPAETAWDLVEASPSTRGTPARGAKERGYVKRSPSAGDEMTAPWDMDADIPEDVKAEIHELQTKLAVLKQKHRVRGGADPKSAPVAAKAAAGK